MVMSEGEAQYAVVVDNGPTIEPYFNETWGACPSTMAADQQEELRTMAMESLKCCGFTTGEDLLVVLVENRMMGL